MPLSAEGHRAVSYHSASRRVKRQESPPGLRLGGTRGGLGGALVLEVAEDRGRASAVYGRLEGVVAGAAAVAAGEPIAGAAGVVVIRERVPARAKYQIVHAFGLPLPQASVIKRTHGRMVPASG